MSQAGPQTGQTGTSGTAAAAHDRLVAAYHAQRERFAPSGDMWSGCAASFRADLNAPLPEFHAKAAEFVRADDVLLDVGGGAGRLSLPLAGHCREVICIDPSPSMREVFEATAREGSVENARFIGADWLDADGIEGDVTFVAHVTYFVPRIAPFIENLHRATCRRVVVVTRTAVPPNQVAPLFRLFRGDDFARAPEYGELLAVLQELGIEAEVIDAGPAHTAVTAPAGATREETVKNQVGGALRLGWVRPEEAERYGEVLAQHFDEFFVMTDSGFRPRNAVDVRDVLITWETQP